MYELGIKQYKSSAYHPESQGALERFHQTLKNMIRSYCFDTEKDWDEGIHLLLFAVRESVQESLGFSPFELVFGHTVCGPLKLLKEKFLSDDYSSLNLLQYVSDFKNRLSKACDAARSNLKSTQSKMKIRYDENAKDRNFEPGDKVLALLPIPGRPLQARYYGPYTVDKKLSDVNYIVNTPGRRKQKQLCHINMLKKYIDRDSSVISSVNIVNSVPHEQNQMDSEDFNLEKSDPSSSKLQNSDILQNLDQKLSHLDSDKRLELKQLVLEYEHLFPDIPSRTDKIYHDVDIIEGSKPVKQHPYRMNPVKQQYLREEVQYLLDNDFIEPSQSEWSSPCILVPKPDGTFRMCTDYRKVNSVTKTDTFPIPRIDDCIDNIGHAKYVTKFDLLKGFWQIPLTDRAKEISAFVTPDGLYQYKVMPFGMKNSPATFQRLVNSLISNLDGCKAYIDDAIIFSEEWQQHLQTIRTFFDRLSDAKLTVNLAKSEFCHANLTFLGHIVGQGQVKPVEAKVEAISDFPVPTSKRQLMRFLGMAGYYRKFCNNFSAIAEPLTNLLGKKAKYVWTDDCQKSFDKLKAILRSAPVLLAPSFDKEFKLAVDASDVGAGSVLLQEDDNGVDHPVCYFSKKFNKHQRNYSTIEKECLSLILALQHFEVYLASSHAPIVVFDFDIVVYDFDFDIVNFPFLDGDVPRCASYGVYISQLIRFARVCNHIADFNARNKCLTAKLLQQGYRYHKLRKTFSKFYRRHYELISKYNVGLKTLLSEGLSEPEFYGDLVYKFKKLKGINDFSFQFRKIITRYRRIGYNLNVMRQSACLVFNPIMVDNYAAFFNCTPVGRASDSMMAPT